MLLQRAQTIVHYSTNCPADVHPWRWRGILKHLKVDVKHANFIVLYDDGDIVVIKDVGPWDRHPTVTNDAEWVVSQLPARSRIYYYDSCRPEPRLDELAHVDGQFTWFRPVPDELRKDIELLIELHR